MQFHTIPPLIEQSVCYTSIFPSPPSRRACGTGLRNDTLCVSLSILKLKQSHAWLPWLIASTLSACEGMQADKGRDRKREGWDWLRENLLRWLTKTSCYMKFWWNMWLKFKKSPNNIIDDVYLPLTLSPFECLVKCQYLYFMRRWKTERDDEPALGDPLFLNPN